MVKFGLFVPLFGFFYDFFYFHIIMIVMFLNSLLGQWPQE